MSVPFDIATLRPAVTAYARALRNALHNDIGVITNWGLTSRSTYQDAALQQHDPRRDVDWGRSRFQMQANQAVLLSPVDPPIPEDQLLREWLAEEREKPLLVVAPVGSGKSSLLESFALRLADDLLDDSKWPLAEPLPPTVPLIIPLANRNGRSLEQHLYQSETEITKAPANLSPETLQYLRNQDKSRLLLLIDGFDEVPAERDTLTKDILELKVCFALTSRPGYGGRVEN